MRIQELLKSQKFKKGAGKPLGILVFGICVISFFQMSWLVEVLLTSSLSLAVAVKLLNLGEELQDKAFKKKLYHLLMELNVGMINLTKSSSEESINIIVEKLRDRNLKEIRYRESLFKKMDLGIVTFGQNLEVKRSSISTTISAILGDEGINKRNIIESVYDKSELSGEEKRSIHFHFTSVLGMGEMQWRLSSGNLPEDVPFKIKGKRSTVRLRYIPIIEDDTVQQISIVLQDITEYKKMESEAIRREKEIEKIFALLQVSDNVFELFMDETRSLFENIKADLKLIRSSDEKEGKEIAGRMFRHVHTIKANSKLFKLNSIQDVAHEVEDYLSDLRSDKIPFEKSAFMALTQKVMAISEEIYSYASLRKEILGSVDSKKDHSLKYRVQWIRSLLNQFANILRNPQFEPRHLKVIQKELGRALSSFDRVSIRDHVKGYDGMIQDVSSQLGKKIGGLEIDLEYQFFEANTLARINDILVHCIRNSIDHGIETPEERLKAGKSETGHIKLSMVQERDVILIKLEDDGHGIEVDKVKAKAVEKEILTPAEAENMETSDALALIFHPGFSTADQVSTISGRGLGMDAVKDAVERINGHLKIDSVTGNGTTIIIELPQDSEELLSPFMIYNYGSLVEGVLNEFQLLERASFNWSKSGVDAIVFGDKWTAVDQVRSTLGEIIQALDSSIPLDVHLESFLGNRRTDSYNFYRLKFELPDNQDERFPVIQENRRLSEIQEKLVSIGGSLIERSAHNLELNLPSNIPVPFSDFKFVVLLVCSDAESLRQPVHEFFRNVMAGWDHRVVIASASEPIPSDVKGKPCVVILDESHCDDYGSIREVADRALDGVLLLTDEHTEIDTLSELELMPQNIIFAPIVAEEGTFERALASIVLRRFLSDMVRTNDAQLQDNPPKAV